MPRKEWTEEQRREMSERMKARHAAAKAGQGDSPAPVLTVEEKPRPESYEPGLKKVKGAVRIHSSARSGHRTIKMIRPICQECQSQDVGPGWWYRCEAKGHNPYFTADHYADKQTETVTEDEDGDLVVTPGPVKRVKILGGPNLAAVPVTGRHNGDHFTSMRHKRGIGWRMPEEMGIAPFCEFSQTGLDCWSQDNLRQYGDLGTFCSVDQAKSVAVDQRRVEKFLETLNDEKKVRQWSQIAI